MPSEVGDVGWFEVRMRGFSLAAAEICPSALATEKLQPWFCAHAMETTTSNDVHVSFMKIGPDF